MAYDPCHCPGFLFVSCFLFFCKGFITVSFFIYFVGDFFLFVNFFLILARIDTISIMRLPLVFHYRSCGIPEGRSKFRNP